ncbi:hypothetical protein QJS10_CPB11g00896 [Acorus calamus]|uniref:Uncharacterized protein n=1 Tax=Acorus calamus TaxID=4465 RepID=A0AAV9DQ53_ACOCL|nr:hypothetical protein QJS10_CPB11g00896 [Acorus calamus]
MDTSAFLGNHLFDVKLALAGSSKHLLVLVNATLLSLNQQMHALREVCVDAQEEHLREFITGYRLGYSDCSRGFREMSVQELPHLQQAAKEKKPQEAAERAEENAEEVTEKSQLNVFIFS